MDDYPEALSPLDDDEVKAPFAEWWPRVRDRFPHVPENVAEHWLHRHWNNSPYGYLPSSGYRFELETWPSGRLLEIRSKQEDFALDHRVEREFGAYLSDPGNWLGTGPHWLADNMREHLRFPVPIIVLDNRDSHIPADKSLPSALVLIEGHRRFAIALHLLATNKFAAEIELWLMRPAR